MYGALHKGRVHTLSQIQLESATNVLANDPTLTITTVGFDQNHKIIRIQYLRNMPKKLCITHIIHVAAPDNYHIADIRATQ